MDNSDMTALEIGIDIGGTKTHLRAYARDGDAHDLVLPTAKWRVRAWEEDAIALLALAGKFAQGTAIASIAVGAHGCDNTDECSAFQVALERRAAFRVQVVNDAELLPAALGLSNQIGLVAGTGSIAVSRSVEGHMLVAGGWGWIIGDEGSASGLMREAGRAVALHLDYGGSADEPLVKLLFKALGISSSARIGSSIGSSGGASALGSHAHIVFEAAGMGSLLALHVIRNGAKELADLVARLKHNGSQSTTVVAGGSVIASQPMLWDAFAEQISTRFTGQVAAKLYGGPPVEGACRLAARLGARTMGNGLPASSST
jgi:glucosamine kinase